MAGDAVGEELLVGDGVTPGIVRIGDTVRRPVRPFTATVHAYLAHLRSVGFAGAPVPLGIDAQGREVLPLLDPRDRAPALTDADIPRRVAVFADAYGMTGQQRQDLVPFAERMIHRFHSSFRAAAQADPAFRRMWDGGVKDRMPRAETWIKQAAASITARLQ